MNAQVTTIAQELRGTIYSYYVRGGYEVFSKFYDFGINKVNRKIESTMSDIWACVRMGFMSEAEAQECYSFLKAEVHDEMECISEAYRDSIEAEDTELEYEIRWLMYKNHYTRQGAIEQIEEWNAL